MALGTVTVGSASKFHAERSGREIQGSHGDPFRALFAFNFDRQFLANIFSSPPPSLKAYPPPLSPQHPIQHQNRHHLSKPYPPKTTKRLQTSIVFSNPCRQHQFSDSTTSIFSWQAGGGLAFKLGGVLGNWTNEKPPFGKKIQFLVKFCNIWSN